MTDDERTRDALDAAIRAHAADLLDAGEAIVGWVALAGTRTLDGGGTVVVLVDEGSVPRWQAKGMLIEALDHTRRDEETEDE